MQILDTPLLDMLPAAAAGLCKADAVLHRSKHLMVWDKC